MYKKKRVLVLGVGLVGSEIARCMSQKFFVTAVDTNTESLRLLGDNPNITCYKMDLLDIENIFKLAEDHDVVIGAMPDSIAFGVLENIVSAGKNIVDISFFEEDPFLLHEMAKEHQIGVYIDCGVAPGMSNLLLGYENEMMDIESFECYVGGLPTNPEPPWYYKAAWSPTGVLSEWVREARYVEDKKILFSNPLESAQKIELPKVGVLDALCTDGLRSLLKTMDIPNMVEKTLRYPGHLEQLQALFDSDCFSPQNKAATLEMIEREWCLGPHEEEFTVMRLVMEGTASGQKYTVKYDMLDYRDKETGVTSMARTTGYTCAAIAHLLLEKGTMWIGATPLERVGAYPPAHDFVLNFLEDRNVHYRRRVS